MEGKREAKHFAAAGTSDSTIQCTCVNLRLLRLLASVKLEPVQINVFDFKVP